MEINSSFNESSQTLTLELIGRLDFASHKDFMMAYSKPAQNYILNMKEVSYLDASALGMLLLLKDYVKESSSISIIQCNPDIYKILELASFNQLFEISKD